MTRGNWQKKNQSWVQESPSLLGVPTFQTLQRLC